MSSINTINVNTPFLIGVPTSRVSPEWIRLLAAIVSSTNSGITPDDTTTIVFTTRRPPDQSGVLNELRNSQQFASLRGLIRDLAQRIEALEAQAPKKTASPTVSSDDVAALLRPRTASGAMSCEVMEDNATNQTFYPVWVSGKNGQQQNKTSSTQWTFNPSTGKMTLTGSIAVQSGTAIPAGGTAGAGFLFSSTSNFGVFFGSGAPTIAAGKGSLYLRSDGTTTNNRAYVNTDGSTTWTALTTAA